MSETSARLGLPLIQPGQAQKELAHNEALAAIDLRLHPEAQAADAITPPASPAIGEGWLLGASPTGAWAGHAHALALWTSGGWRFADPVAGMLVWVAADGLWARWTGSGWALGDLVAASITIGGDQVLGARAGAIADPAGGTSIDAEARATIGTILAALRSHGLITP